MQICFWMYFYYVIEPSYIMRDCCNPLLTVLCNTFSRSVFRAASPPQLQCTGGAASSLRQRDPIICRCIINSKGSESKSCHLPVHFVQQEINMSAAKSRLSGLLGHFRPPSESPSSKLELPVNRHGLSPTIFLPRAASIEPEVCRYCACLCTYS
jgi:hypothetical protein